ncbi:MAG: excisionase [Acidobacteriota bacterium]
MLSIKDAANAAGVTTRTIHNWKEKLHVLETPGGRKLICKPSIVRLCSDNSDRR